ncbi:MAG: transposase [Sandaracinaceae bacterium]|nr:transposase [Sandaracinaceae bacterium]
MPAAFAAPPCPLTYERRDPSAGPLHQVLSDKLESYLEARAGRPLPGFVVDTLRGFLRCGILRHGFARFRCDDCAQSRLVALSCKQRAFCPRCVGRKMAYQAKHLVENVLPPVPYRQWVLSFPHALRWRMAHNHELTLAIWRIARVAIDALYRSRAASLGPPGQHDSARPGSVMAIQRFGGALNLNVHFHALYTDGSFYERSDGQLVFLLAAPPTQAELAALVADIKRRVVLLLENLGLGPGEDDDWDAQQLLLGMGELYGEGVFHKGAQRLRNGKPQTPSTFARRKAHEDGFDLDAQVTVSAGARASLEQLVRYILRPPLKETRMTIHSTSVELTLKTPWRDGTTQILLTPDRFIDRLVALVPPPRVNTLLYGGLFAANARLRPLAVAYQRPGVILRKRARPAQSPKPRNTAWAELMRHSFGLDVLACPHCGGRMRHVATVLDHSSIQRILRHQGLDTPEPRARSSPLESDLRYEPDEHALADAPQDDFSQLDPSDPW